MHMQGGGRDTRIVFGQGNVQFLFLQVVVVSVLILLILFVVVIWLL